MRSSYAIPATDSVLNSLRLLAGVNATAANELKSGYRWNCTRNFPPVRYTQSQQFWPRVNSNKWRHPRHLWSMMNGHAGTKETSNFREGSFFFLPPGFSNAESTSIFIFIFFLWSGTWRNVHRNGKLMMFISFVRNNYRKTS